MTGGANIHATCIATEYGAALILGPSGSGKSDLALRLIDRGARLVSDDRVLICNVDGRLVAASPGVFSGRLEVRGVGICSVPAQKEAIVGLVVHLGEEGERLPDGPVEVLEGISLPLLKLDPHRASAPIKVELALSQGVGTS